MQAEQQSERERFEAWCVTQGWVERPSARDNGNYTNGQLQARWIGWQARAALSHPSPQGWKQIGWTCGDGDCWRIHDTEPPWPVAQPVYVPAHPEQGSRNV